MSGWLESVLPEQPAADLARPPTEKVPTTGPSAEGPGWSPRPGWPTDTQLRYTQLAIVVALLLIALPWLLRELLTNPRKAVGQVAP